MALLQFNNYELENTSHSVTVPDNPIAHLMYYLQSVGNVINIGNSVPGFQKITNYRAYNNITDRELIILIRLCEVLSPIILIDRVFFQNVQLCGNSLNQFYNLRNVQHTIAAARSIVIGNKRVSVTKIMTYKPRWFQVHYYTPMRQIKTLLNML